MKKINILVLCLLFLLTTEIKPQSLLEGIGSKIKDKIEEKAEERVDAKTDEVIDKSLDKIEKPDSKEDSDKAVTEDETKTTKKGEQKLVANTKYDFVPGDKILYFEDFSQDAIGDFPALWSTDGGGEVKTLNIAPGNWLHFNKEGCFYCYNKMINFPRDFIMEFDFIPDENFQNDFELHIYSDNNESENVNTDLYPGTRGIQIFMNEGGWATKGYTSENDMKWLEAHSSTNPPVINSVNHVIVWVQNRRIRIYHKGEKALDCPTNIYQGNELNKIRFSSWNSGCKPYITNLKVTTAAPDMRSKLITEGKLVSYGIYFDVNKDVVKPESFGTLNEIAKALKENPAVNVKIIGHTDSDGNDDQNLDLSKRRAASVKKTLSTEFGIDGNRIQTEGKGEAEPIAPNTTTENKAKNRRVEFIKL